MLLSDTAIRRPVTTLVAMAAMIIFGWIAFQNMGLDLFPEVDFPYVTVTTTLIGASPEVIDMDVTDVLEEQITTIEGIKTVRSASYGSMSRIFVEFDLDKDVDVAAQEVRAKVNLAERDLPDDADKPIVDKLDVAAQAIMWIAVSSRGDYARLAHYADKVAKERFQSIRGVGMVQTAGLREREIRVWVDPAKLEARGLSPQDVVRAIKLKHVELPGGRIERLDKEYSVKIEGEYRSVEELKGLVVSSRDGAVTRLRDVATVVDDKEDLRTVARFNGVPTIGLGIRKQSGTNTVEIARRVKATLEEMRKTVPEGMHLDIGFDASEFVEASMEGVQVDILIGVLLTSLIMLLFLRNIRITLISVVAIPISLIGGFVVIYAMGFTINNMTMLAISLAVGMVIDDTIVVLENIYRHVEEGAPAMQAASQGTSEVGLAVIAATSSIVAVFIPVAFMKGIIGRFFYQFGLTVAVTIAISAVVSLTLTPMLCSRLLKREEVRHPLYVRLERGFESLESAYRRILGWVTRHRIVTVLIAVAAFGAGMALTPFIGKEFNTQDDEGRFMVRFEMPTGTSIYETEERLRKIEEIVFSQPETKHGFSAIGMMGGEVNIGIMVVHMIPRRERDIHQIEFMSRLRELLGAYEDMTSSIEYISIFGGGQRHTDIEYIIQGPDVSALAEVSDRVVKALKGLGGFVDVDTNLRITKPEVKIHIDRGLADDLGVDVRSISQDIYTLFGGIDAGKFKEGGERYDIRIRALPADRDNPEDLYQIAVRSLGGTLVKAPNLLNIEVGQGPNVVNRHNRRRSVKLYANLEDKTMGQAMDELENTVSEIVPRDGKWGTATTGQSRMFKETFVYMGYAMMVAVLIIYMVLAAQFESFIHPLTVMLSLPLCVVGVFGLLLITGNTLNILSYIGMIMLMGIVTKNAILLVDYTNTLRSRGVEKVEAVLQAGPTRFRPILMTAGSTIIAVLPVALGMSEGGESRAPMAVAVIGGMFTSTFLTLLVIPVVYLLLDDFASWLRRLFRGSATAVASAQGTEGTKS
jgi:HAE1 family hydrophobic/amphiphilic exporter-1